MSNNSLIKCNQTRYNEFKTNKNCPSTENNINSSLLLIVEFSRAPSALATHIITLTVYYE